MYSEVLKYVFWGNSILDYMMAGIILVGGFILIKIGLCYFIKRLKNFAGKTPSKIGEFFSSGVEKIGIPFLYLLIVYLSVKTLTFGPDMERGLNYFVWLLRSYFPPALLLYL